MESCNHNTNNVTTLGQTPQACRKQDTALDNHVMVDSSKRLRDRWQLMQCLQTSLRNMTASQEHALLRISFDRSKTRSDTERRAAGHTLNRQIRDLVLSAVGDRYVLAELTADDYAVLLQHTSESEAVQAARMLRATVQRYRYQCRDKLVEVGVSIGVVVIRDTNANATDVLAAAEKACAEAKRKPYNYVMVSRPSGIP